MKVEGETLIGVRGLMTKVDALEKRKLRRAPYLERGNDLRPLIDYITD